MKKPLSDCQKERRAEYQKKKRARKHNAARDPVRDLGREFVNKKIKTGIQKRFGLPEDCMVFRVPQFGETKERVVTCGTVVLVNLAGNKLICVARFNKEDLACSDSKEVQHWKDFRRAIKIMHQHSEARGVIKENHAVKMLPKEERQGTMKAFGHRSSQRAGKYKRGTVLATYSQNSATSKSPAKLDKDEARQDELPWVEDFHAEMTSSLSLFAYDSNKKLAEETNAPSWAAKAPIPGSKEWEKSPNAQVFGEKNFVGSNVIVTTGGFRNGGHCDYDATGFASGFFCLIDANTSEIISPARRMQLLAERKEEMDLEKKTGKCINKKHPQVGTKFVIEINKFKFIIDINAADVVELLWATDVPHYTDHHLFSAEEKKRTTYLQGAVTRAQNNARKGDEKIKGPVDHVLAYACSTQISTTVVAAMKEIMAKRGDMDDESWEKLHSSIAETYDKQLERKRANVEQLESKIKLYKETKGSALRYLK